MRTKRWRFASDVVNLNIILTSSIDQKKLISDHRFSFFDYLSSRLFSLLVYFLGSFSVLIQTNTETFGFVYKTDSVTPSLEIA